MTAVNSLRANIDGTLFPADIGTKTSDEALTVALDLTQALNGSTLSNVVWSSIPGGLTIGSTSHTTTTATAKLSGGSKETYRVQALATLASGDVRAFEARLKVVGPDLYDYGH